MKGAFLALFTVFAAGCRPVAQEHPAYTGSPVILISIDTLRADHLPAYGYSGVKTPNIDSFRADSVLFEHAWSHAPMTLPSHLSMLTGLLPYEHGVRDNIGYTFAPSSHPSLPRILEKQGYATGAAVSSYVLRGETGMRRMFDFYQDSINPRPEAKFDEFQRPGNETVRFAQQWIDEQKEKPFFFFLHLYEPHVPYDPPEPFRSRFPSAYDGEIATADDIVGTFLVHLKETGVYDRAIIILTSDHGEGLGDHGEEQHSVLVYREALSIPLLIKLPGSRRGGEAVAAPAQLIDILPTVTELLGLTTPPKLEGSALMRRTSADPERRVYAESLYPRIHFGWSELRSLVDRRFQYIESPRPELYDLSADPAERRNIIGEQRRVAASMREELERIPKGAIETGSVDPEVAAKLSALGYIGSVKAGEGAGPLTNPVDNIRLFERIRTAFEKASSGDRQAGRRALEELLAENPELLDVRVRLAELLAGEGELPEAIEQYGEAIRRSPVFPADVAVARGSLLLRTGQLDDAGRHARLALAEVPGKARELLARVALARKDFAEAERQAEAMRKYRETPQAFLLLAEIHQKEGNFPAALSALDRAEALAREQGMSKLFRLQFLRGDTMARMERLDEASRAYELEIRDFPNDVEAYAALAIVRFIEGNRRGVDAVLERLVRSNPNRASFLLAAKTMEALGEDDAAERWRKRAE